MASESHDEPGEGKLIPAPSSDDRSFVARLARELGHDVDPEISLQADSAAPGESRAPRGGEPASSSTETGGLFLKLSEKDPHARRYRVKGELARGGMGAILRVWDDDLRRNLAMKVLLSRRGNDDLAEESPRVDEELLSRFLEEAQITGQLDHPGIVPVHDLGIDARGRVYFTMRLVRGRDLKSILDLLAEGKEGWTLTKALHVVLKVCEAMAFAHSKGVVHRDLKPANVMVGRFGETYVMDWGLARVLGRRDSHDLRLKPADASALSLVRTARRADQAGDPKSPLVTMDGDVIGTPSYMAPEQAQGRLEDVGPRSDVYSLGAILYQMLTGQAPYVKPGAQLAPHTVLMSAIEGPPTPVDKLKPDLPGELVAICHKAMAREPEERYPTMLEMAADIEAFLEGRVVGAYETGPLAEARKWVQRNRGLAATIALALLLGTGGVAGVIAVQVTKARELAAANQGLTVAKTRAEDKEAEAVAAEQAAKLAAAEAEAAQQEAVRNATVAQTRSYVSNIRAAEYTLRLRQVAETLALLDRCDADLRGWEWDHLVLRCQSQLGAPAHLTTPIARLVLGERDSPLVLTDNGVLSIFDATAGGLADQRPLTDRLWPIGMSPEVDLDLDPTGTVAAVLRPRSRQVVLLDAAGHAAEAPPDLIELFAPSEIVAGDGGTLPPDGFAIDAVAGARPCRVRFGPRDDLLAVGYDDGAVLLWDHAARELLPVLGAAPPVGGAGASADESNGEVHALAWSRDGARLAAATADGVVRIWSLGSAAPELELEAHEGAALALAFEPTQGRLLASGGADGRVRLWSLPDGRQVARHSAHTGAVGALAFYPDGRALVSGSADTTLQMWDLGEASARAAAGGDLPAGDADSRELRTLFGHEGPIADLAVGGEGALVFSAGRDGSLRAWDPEFSGPVTDLIDGRFTAPDAHVRLAQVTAVAFHPDGWTCLTGHWDGTIAIWDTLRGELVDLLRGHRHTVTSAVWGPRGATILSASRDKDAILWDVANRRERHRFKHDSFVNSAAIAPDGTFVVTADADKTARVFSAATGEEILRLEGHEDWVNAVAVTPDGREAWTASRDGKLRLWSLDTGAKLAELGDQDAEGRSVEIASLALSADGALLAAGLGDGQVGVLDVAAWRAGRSAASGGGTPWLFFRETTANGEPVTALAFHPGGMRLFAGSIDGSLRIYHTRIGDHLLTLRGHAGGISGIALSPDGKRVLSGSAVFEQGATYVRPGESVARVWEIEATPKRRAARREAAMLRRQAEGIVESLFETYILQGRVIENLARTPLPAPELRPIALRLAMLRNDDPLRLAEDSWRIVRAQEASPEAVTYARRRAEAAVGVKPDSELCLAVLGATRVRSGWFEPALESFQALKQLGGLRLDARAAAIRDAFSALAHEALGHADEARAAFDAFLASPQAGDPEFAGLRAELDARLGEEASDETSAGSGGSGGDGSGGAAAAGG